MYFFLFHGIDNCLFTDVVIIIFSLEMFYYYVYSLVHCLRIKKFNNFFDKGCRYFGQRVGRDRIGCGQFFPYQLVVYAAVRFGREQIVKSETEK